MDVKVRGLLPFFGWFQHFSSSFFFFTFRWVCFKNKSSYSEDILFASESGYVNLGISEIIFKYYFLNRGTF